ncbi:MAG: GguC family protein [Desulfuromonadales bacterium]|nr:GguC family protein [Desulfuromonadales bacterium]
MRIVQFYKEKGAENTQVAVVGDDGESLNVVAGVASTYELARQALAADKSFEEQIADLGFSGKVDYNNVLEERRLLPPVTHPDPAHMLLTGTGLTHLGSASTRSAMHARNDDQLTDSMKMFRLGLEGGKPAPGQIGTEPEWFYKGDGRWLVAPGQELELPGYAQDGGEEPEVVGAYLIGDNGTPFRLGYAIANEFSDHVLERQNYLWLAHSKLRQSSFGPELLIGELPQNINGKSRILRGGEVLWEKDFASGEENMSHSIANLEYHHFKYRGFRVPGDVHVHFFGTATLSFADKIKPAPGDVFEISAAGFGKPLRNPLVAGEFSKPEVRSL